MLNTLIQYLFSVRRMVLSFSFQLFHGFSPSCVFFNTQNGTFDLLFFFTQHGPSNLKPSKGFIKPVYCKNLQKILCHDLIPEVSFKQS